MPQNFYASLAVIYDRMIRWERRHKSGTRPALRPCLTVFCLAVLVLSSGCAYTSFTPVTSSVYPSYHGKVILLTNETGKQNVPGATEIGVIKVTTWWPWLSNADHVIFWKKEAARQGANAVRYDGEGRGDLVNFTFAKAYRLAKIDDPSLTKYWASPSGYYHN